jgi:uncharacterized protein YndB with AHSA1/START domain
MRGPDGTDYPNACAYLEIKKHALLVYDHGRNEGEAPLFRVTVRFSAVGKKTRMEMTMALPSPEAARQTRIFIKQAGGESTWDRLAEHLAEAAGEQVFVITRVFDAPIDVMWRMWTDPEHVARWMPPTGFSMRFMRVDLRAGGSSHYGMANESGQTMYGRAEYRELTPPTRIVYTQQFCDAHERVARHPMAPTWPETMLTEVTLAEEGPDRTRVTVRWTPYGPTTPDEVETFIKGRSGMTMGWTGSFDKLEAALAA